jgi:hypothetical protein
VKSFIAIATVCLLLISYAPAGTTAAAQTHSRRSTSSRNRRATTGAPASRLDQTRFNAQRLELAGLSKDLTRFLYLYGRLSKDLELTNAQSGASDATSQTKARLIENVQAMRDRLDQLESHFRFAQGLETQYQTLNGVSASAEQAARMVANNQFDQAGKKLLEVASQLTDVLLEMQ